ncbi:SIR2 family protein [Lentzea sp. NPDC005914]|uniref:SIR2 family protein n=1 Tax=Lentzea sp. NPDC005914 TaxID=3154572 RepID=UPI0033D47A63
MTRVGYPPAMQQFRRENHGAVELLRDQMRDWNSFTLFIGAGLSRPFGYRLWGEFLRNVAESRPGLWLKVRPHMKSDLSKVAQVLEDQLGVTSFRRAVANEFKENGKLRSFTQSVYPALAVLPDLVNGPVITTNLDHVLEHVFAAMNRPFSRVVWGERAQEIIKNPFMAGGNLIKFHGDYTDPAAWVLTTHQYNAMYGKPDELESIMASDDELKQWPLPHLLSLVTYARPLFFIGCSLRQDRTLDVLDRLASNDRANPHVALLERPSTAEELDQRRHALDPHGILPIWYPLDQHGCVAGFLQYLRSQKPRHQR